MQAYSKLMFTSHNCRGRRLTRILELTEKKPKNNLNIFTLKDLMLRGQLVWSL